MAVNDLLTIYVVLETELLISFTQWNEFGLIFNLIQEHKQLRWHKVKQHKREAKRALFQQTSTRLS